MIKLVSLFSLLLACCVPNLEVETSSDSDPLIDNRPWETWDECGYMPGDHLCNFTLLDQNNNEVELYDFYGEVIILDLSAMWCGICVNIAGTSEALIEDLGPERVVWITVLIEDESGLQPDQSDLLRWESQHGGTGHILAGSRSMIASSGNIGYPVSGWPTVIVIDQKMVIHNGVTGWSESLVRSWVTSLL